jgi:hypothetical protein
MSKKLCLLAVVAIMTTAPSLILAQDPTVWSSQNYVAALSVYNQKYGFSTEALRRAFPGNENVIAGKQVQDRRFGWGVTPPRVVCWAANVDAPKRGMRPSPFGDLRPDGELFIAYLRQPAVHNWYRSNFGLR